MTKDNKAITVSELIAAIIPYIEDKRYSKSYVSGLNLI